MSPLEKFRRQANHIKTIIRGKVRQAQDIAADVWLIALPLFLVTGLFVVTVRFWIWATSWVG